MSGSKFNVSGLGDSLIKNIAQKVNTIESKADFNLINIDLDLLVPNPNNFYGMRDIDELATDIQEHGLLHNLVVRPLADGKYEIISGERRYQALRKRGIKKAPCQVKDTTDDVDTEIMLIQANAKSRELTDIEKSKQVVRLEELYNTKKANGEKIDGKLRDRIGQDMGISGVQVQRYKKINNDLIPELKEMLENKKITMINAFEFANLNEDQQKAVYEFLKTNIDASKDEIQLLKQQLKDESDKHASEIEKLNRDNETLYKELDDLKDELQEKSSTIDSLNADIEQTKKDIEKELKDKLQNENSKEVQDLKKKLESLESQKRAAEDKLNKINDDYKKAIAEKEELERKDQEENAAATKNIELNTEISVLAKSLREASMRFLVKYQTCITDNEFSINKDNIDILSRFAKDNLKNVIDILESLSIHVVSGNEKN